MLMRGFLINKNLSFYYWLRKRVGKKWACKVAITVENGILIFRRPRLREDISREEPADLRTCRLNDIKK
jgi:hypothetical protein